MWQRGAAVWWRHHAFLPPSCLYSLKHVPCTHPHPPHLLPDVLLRKYRQAMALEAEFFGAQPFAAPPRTVGLLVVDFDDTCTVSDTTGLIAQTAIAATVHRVGGRVGGCAGGAGGGAVGRCGRLSHPPLCYSGTPRCRMPARQLRRKKISGLFAP